MSKSKCRYGCRLTSVSLHLLTSTPSLFPCKTGTPAKQRKHGCQYSTCGNQHNLLRVKHVDSDRACLLYYPAPPPVPSIHLGLGICGCMRQQLRCIWACSVTFRSQNVLVICFFSQSFICGSALLPFLPSTILLFVDRRPVCCYDHDYFMRIDCYM